jgi:hypothetical protein
MVLSSVRVAQGRKRLQLLPRSWSQRPNADSAPLMLSEQSEAERLPAPRCGGSEPRPRSRHQIGRMFQPILAGREYEFGRPRVHLHETWTRSHLRATKCIAVDHLLPLFPTIRGSSYRRNRFGSLPSSISYNSSQAGSERTMAAKASYAFPRSSYCLGGLDNFRSCHSPRISQCMLAIPLPCRIGPDYSRHIASRRYRRAGDRACRSALLERVPRHRHPASRDIARTRTGPRCDGTGPGLGDLAPRYPA